MVLCTTTDLTLFSVQLLAIVFATVPVQFALLPDEFSLDYGNTTSVGSAATAQECLDLAWATTNDTKVIKFSSGSCELGRAIYGYRAKGGSDPQYWVSRCGEQLSKDVLDPL